jgi:hypothetical protein
MAAATTIAAVSAGIAAAGTIATTTMSFTQAADQKSKQRQAERDADEAMREARKKLETNFYSAQSIKKEPYELEREALLSQGAQAIQAGVESERGAAATAGRVQLAQQQGQAGIRTAMSQELTALENKQLQEQSRLRDIGVQLDLGEVSGAQLAKANAAELGAQATQQAMQGVTSLAQQAAQFVPLFAKEGNINPNTGLPYNIDPSTGKSYTTNDVSKRPVAGQYALPNQGQQLFNPFLNSAANPYSAYYTNPAIGG